MDGDDPDLALRAMVATLGMGEDAIPCLMRGLTNRFPDVRSEAANCLTGEWGQRYPEQRKQVIPFLVKLLNDPEQSVRMNVTNELKEFDLQAATGAGIK
jgi:HEAT repeat protein